MIEYNIKMDRSTGVKRDHSCATIHMEGDCSRISLDKKKNLIGIRIFMVTMVTIYKCKPRNIGSLGWKSLFYALALHVSDEYHG
jgi:hypothetical protein